MTSSNSLETKALTWLEAIFKKHKISNLSVKIAGNTEKGDGYMGDIVFANVRGTEENGDQKEFKLVLKCSKQSEVLRKDERFRAATINEIFFYDQVLPTYLQFQEDRGVESPFKSTPKCYGTYQDETIEVIALEDLRSEGFELYPRKQCLTRKHIELVLAAYAKYHATSIAMKIQEPEQFDKFAKQTKENLLIYEKDRDGPVKMFQNSVDDVINALKDDFDENTLQKLNKLKENVRSIFEDLINTTATRVISHGDCWSNNFMYKYSPEDQTVPSEVKILDWQMIRYTSLICDLTYFLFVCISEEDMENLDEIIGTYHKNLIRHLTALGISGSSTVYPYEKFLEEWRRHCLYGVLLAGVLIKVHSVEKEDVVDSAAAAKEGKQFMELFLGKAPDKNVYRYRMRYIVEYAVKNKFI